MVRGYVWSALVCAVFWLCLTVLQYLLQPQWSAITYTTENGVAFTEPVGTFFDQKTEVLTLQLTATLPWGASQQWYIKPDDCLRRMVINYQELPESISNFCDYSAEGRVLDLSAYLHPGANQLEFTLYDHGGKGGLNMSPAANALHTGLQVLWFISIIISLFCLSQLTSLRRHPATTLILLLGIALRILYAVHTPYTERGHDTDAHMDYIQYVAQEFRIPPAQDGWEYHQAPLYYFLAGSWWRLIHALGATEPTILWSLQLWSLVCSILTAGLALWIGHLLWPKANHWPLRALFGFWIVTIPSLIFVGNRLGNGALWTLLAFLLTALLLQHWKSPSPARWYRLVFALAIGLLTKLTALLFIPITGLVFLLKRQGSIYQQSRHLACGIMVFLLVTGWYPIWRLSEADTSRTVTLGNQGMHSGLAVSNTWENWLTFNPIAVVQKPYNNPWEDAARRQYYWEYLWRSIWFGEFNHGDPLLPLARGIMLLSLLLLPFGLVGLFWAVFRQAWHWLPLWLMGVGTLTSLVAYRFFSGYSSNQDIRFGLVGLLLLAIGLAHATTLSRSLWYTRPLFIIIGLLVVLQAGWVGVV